MLDNEVTMLLVKQIEEKRGGHFFSSIEDLIKEILTANAKINEPHWLKVAYPFLKGVFWALLGVLFFKIWAEQRVLIGILMGIWASHYLIGKYFLIDSSFLYRIFDKAEKIKETYTTLISKEMPFKHQFIDLSKYGGGLDGFKEYVKFLTND